MGGILTEGPATVALVRILLLSISMLDTRAGPDLSKYSEVARDC
jgi:hypothetical protein